MAEGREVTEEQPLEAVTLLRTIQQHHVHLSAMADQKAGFLIGSSVVLIGLVISNLDSNSSLALILVGLAALAALVLSIIAVIPRYYAAPSGEHRPNRLFFGVFSHMDEDEFIQYHLEETFADSTSMRRAMLRDIYQMGSALNAKKFRYLGYAFRVALWGMVVAVAVAIVDAVN